MKLIVSSIVCLTFVLFSQPTFAQTNKGTVKGVILSAETGKPLENATVSLLLQQDSTTVGYKVSAKNGSFSFAGINYGDYFLAITYIGHSVKEYPFSLSRPELVLDSIHLLPESATLDEVVVSFKKPPIVVKEDTLEFNADSYKVKPESLAEDLLKKLPGIEVDRDGNITAQGQEVTKVYVDGKPFFGGDFKMATQNLPADIIDKIQLIDQKSDKARFTKVDDGQREKIINITIKKNKKVGYFGRASAGAGTDDRYNARMNLNRFKNSRQMSVFGSANNVNASDKNGGGGGGKDKDGLNTTQRLGFNYRNSFKNKLDLSSSIAWNNNNSLNIKDLARQDLRADTNTGYNEQSRAKRSNQRFNWNADLEYKPDSMTEIRGRINATYSMGENSQQSTFQRLKDFYGQLSEGRRINSSESNNLNFSGDFNYMRRFKKAGRSITFGLSANTSDNGSDSYLDYENLGVTENYTPFSDIRKQYTEKNSRNNNARFSFSYTEPILEKYLLDFSYGYAFNKANDDTRTFDWLNGEYTDVNDSLTNFFRNNSHTQDAALKFVGTGKNYTYNFGARMQDITRENFNVSKDILAKQSFTNVVPSAGISFFNKKGRNANIFYNGDIKQPTLQQLQPVPEASNPMYQFLGNPDLVNEYSHNFSYKYEEFISSKEISISANGRLTTVENKIINYSDWDSTGKQFARPINIDGTWNTGLWANTSFPIIRKVLRVSFNTGGSYNKGKAFVRQPLYDGLGKKVGDTSMLNTSTGITYNFGGGLNLDVNDILSFSYRGRMNKNNVRYSDEENMNTNFSSYTHSFDLDLDVPGGITMKTGFDVRTNKGGTATYNQSVYFWNAELSKHFLKRRLFVSLQGYDLLNQNQNVNRSVTANAIVDEISNALNRYFMLSVSYRLNKFGAGGKGGKRPVGGGNNGGGKPRMSEAGGSFNTTIGS